MVYGPRRGNQCIACVRALPLPGMYGHGTVEQTCRDIPRPGQAVTILVERKRFRCRVCARTQFDAIPDLDDKRFAARRLVGFIHQESFRRPFLPIAADIGIDEKTVRNVFEDHAEHLRQTIKFETPTWLGIDKLKIIGDYRCTITNIEKRAIFDLLPTPRQHDLTPYFRQLPDKDKVQWPWRCGTSTGSREGVSRNGPTRYRFG